MQTFCQNQVFFIFDLLPEKLRHVAFFQNSLFILKQTQISRLVTQRLLQSLLVRNTSASLRLISSCGLFSGSRYSPNHDKCLSCSHHQFSLRREFVIEVPSLLCEVHQEVNSHSLQEMHNLNNKGNANGSFGLETKAPDGS